MSGPSAGLQSAAAAAHAKTETDKTAERATPYTFDWVMLDLLFWIAWIA
jgi:hypothetical protein